MGALVLFMLPACLIILSLFGLGLPAIVARNASCRFWSGFRSSPGIAWRLILGPGLVGGAVFAVGALLAPRLDRIPALQTGVGLWAVSSVGTTLGFLSTTLAVAILCHAYIAAYPPADPGGAVTA
jgi:hypothetical protein